MGNGREMTRTRGKSDETTTVTSLRATCCGTRCGTAYNRVALTLAPQSPLDFNKKENPRNAGRMSPCDRGTRQTHDGKIHAA